MVSRDARTALIVALVIALLTAATSPVSATTGNGGQPIGLVSIESEGQSASVFLPDYPNASVELSARPSSPETNSGVGLVPLSDVTTVAVKDAAGNAILRAPHSVEVAPAVAGHPAYFETMVPGVEVELPVDSSTAAQFEPHQVGIYHRASSSDPWTPIASAYDRLGTGAAVGHGTELGEFAVFARPDRASAMQAGPTIVLDPDNDLGRAFWPSLGQEVGELEKSFELAEGIAAQLRADCGANVVLTRDSAVQDPVAVELRAQVARNADPDLTVTLAFNAINSNPTDPFWGGNDAGSGGARIWTANESDRFGERFLEDVESYTTRPAPEGINQSSPVLPYASFDDPDLGTYVHLEAMFLDNAFDQPVVENGLPQIIDWVTATIQTELESKGLACGDAPQPPPEGKLSELRNLGYQNFLAYGADPVSFGNGNFLTDENLFTLTGVGDQAIDLTLTYNSRDDRDTVFGKGWSFAYGTSIKVDSSQSAQVRMGDGSTFNYAWNGSGWDVPDGANTTLEKVGDQLELTFNRSNRLRFSEREFGTWVMSEMVDRQGNSMAFTWGDRSGDIYSLLEIVDEAGQRVVLTPNGSGQVQTVEHPDGRRWSLSYAGRNLESITDPRGVVRSFDYTAQGWLESITVTEGSSSIDFVQNEYDGFGRVVAQTDGESNTRTISYQPLQNGETRTTYTDARGNETKYRFNQLGQLVETVDQLGGSATSSYGDSQDRYNLSEETDARGRTWRTSYDAKGRPTERVDPEGNVSTYSYNSFGDLVATSQPDGLGGERTTTFEIDDKGRITKTTYDDGTFETSTFDDHGDQLSHTDANGKTTTYGFDSRGNVVATTDPEGGVAQASYTLSNRLESLTDARGNKTSYYYDLADNLVRVVDPLGAEWQTTYGPGNEMLTQTDPLGRVTNYTYDANLNLTGIDFPDGTSETYVLDPEYNVIETVDRRGLTIQVTYDQLNRSSKFTDQTGAQWSTQYDAVGNPIEVTDPVGDTIQMEYDGLGRMVKQTDPLGFEWVSTYDEAGNLIALDNPDGTRTTSEYDAVGQLLAVVDEEGQRMTFDYDAVGNPILDTDRRGNVTRTSYDGLNRPVTIVNPDGGTTLMVYDPVGNLISATDPIGGEVRAEYDQRNYLTVTTDEVGATNAVSYDAVGNPVRFVDAEGFSWITEYDQMNRPISQISPNGDSNRATYDGANNIIERTMADGRVDRFNYNGRNQLVEVIENYVAGAPGSADVNVSNRFTFSVDGNLQTIINPNGSTTTHEYDGLGRIIRSTDPIGRVESYRYDAVGNKTQHVDGNGNTRTRTFYPDRQLKSISYSDGTTEQYTYDADNYRTSMVDSTGTTTWQHDWRGKETATNDANGNDVIHTYDLAGNVVGLTYPDGFQSLRTFDKASRLETLTDRSGQIQVGRDRLGRQTSIQHPNGLQTSYVYDPEGNIESIDYQKTGFLGGDRARFDYQYTPDNLVERRQISHYGLVHETDEYTYDGVDRLVASSTSGPLWDLRSSSYSYDAASNRISMRTSDDPSTAAIDEVTASYTYDAADQLLNESRTYSAFHQVEVVRDYDRNGNQVSESKQTSLFGSPFGAPEVEEFSYNLADHLVGDSQNRWRRDGLGRSVGWSSKGSLTTADSYVDQVHDGPYLIAQRHRLLNESYFRDADMIAVSQSVLWDAVTESLVTDQIGTVFGTGDAFGSVERPDRFSDFGESYDKSLLNTYFGFAGEIQDKVTGRLHFHARMYDPATGRFLKPDPLEGSRDRPATLHPYLYAFASPISYTDQLGYWGVPGFVKKAASATVSGVTKVGSTVATGAKAAGSAVATGAKVAYKYRHEILDACGMAPGVGEVCDVANGALYLAEGNYVDAALSMGSAIPFAGNAVTAAKHARKAKKTYDATKKVTTYADEVVDVSKNVDRVTDAAKRSDTAPTRAPNSKNTPNRAKDSPSQTSPKNDTVSDASSSSTPASKPASNATAPKSQPKPATESTPSGRQTNCKMNSFVPGTLVLMADGSTTSIRDVEVGDFVWASDPETGEAGPRRVTDLIEGSGPKRLVDLEVGDDTLTATDGHPLWVNSRGEWVDAEDVQPGDLLLTPGGVTVTVDEVEAYNVDDQHVHNLTVNELHTYYVVVNGESVLVHNIKKYDCNTPAPSTAVEDSLAIARNQRNDLAEEMGSNGPGAFTGAVDSSNPNSAVAACSGGGRCAEQNAVDALGIDPSDAQFTHAYGYRRGEYVEIPICVNCQGRYSPSQFPDSVLFDRGGPWSE